MNWVWVAKSAEREDVTMSLRSFRVWIAFLASPKRMSVLMVRSCASSSMMHEYRLSIGSVRTCPSALDDEMLFSRDMNSAQHQILRSRIAYLYFSVVFLTFLSCGLNARFSGTIWTTWKPMETPGIPKSRPLLHSASAGSPAQRRRATSEKTSFTSE